MKDVLMIDDTLAERLRRWPAKPFPFGSVGSNPTGVVFSIMIKQSNQSIL